MGCKGFGAAVLLLTVLVHSAEAEQRAEGVEEAGSKTENGARLVSSTAAMADFYSQGRSAGSGRYFLAMEIFARSHGRVMVPCIPCYQHKPRRR